VVDAIERHRLTNDYLVGCDEVLTGFWRTHRSHFLCAGGRGLRPDVVALSKAMSDALVPVGAAMVTADVFDSAERHAPATAQWLRDVHRDDMAAGLALAAIEEGERGLGKWDVLATGLEECLRVATSSDVFGGYRRHGLLSRLVLAPDLLGANPDPGLVDHCEAVVTRFIADRCSAITLQLRILPAITSESADAVLAALERVSEELSQLSRSDVYRALGRSVAGIAVRESSTTVLRAAARWRDRPASN
jgi:ornithine--oxo-acid transaminase